MNKKYTEKTAAAICRKVLKSCKQSRPKNTEFHTGWTDAAGRACFCDGYRAYRLKSQVDGVPMAEPGKIPMNLDTAFRPLDAGKVVEMPAPDPDAVKTFIAEHRYMRKAKNIFDKTPYDLGELFPLVNPEFVADVLRLFPGGKWYVSESVQARQCAPVFIVHEQGTACILPVKPGPEKARQFEDQPAQAEETASPAQVEPAPVEAPAEESAYYFVYAKLPGAQKFSLMDMSRGMPVTRKIQATILPGYDTEKLKAIIDHIAALNPGTLFQLRKEGARNDYYNAVPTFSPEEFAELYAA